MQPQRLLSGVAILCLAVAAMAQQTAPPPPPTDDYSGMYSFLKEGEFVQVTVEEQGKVTGFVSRYGDLESDRGAFLDHFFKDGKLDGHDLTFTTDTRHGVWYEFKGKVERGAGKARADEAYYVLKGTLTEHGKDAANKDTVRQREVEFKLFPADLNPEQGKKE
jgi:hypothetical protein